MIDTHYGQKLAKGLVTTIARQLTTFGISANQITTLGLLFGLLIPAAANFSILIALSLLLLSGICDVLDGVAARIAGQASPLGSCYDIVSDRIVESAIVLALYFQAPVERSLLCLLMLASILICVTSFLVVSQFLNEKSHKSFCYSPGIMERTEAFCFFFLMLALPSSFAPLSILFSTLVLLTAIIRIYQFSKKWQC